MHKIAISKFKAQCLSILEQVRRTGQAIQVTRFGKAVAEVHPPAPAKREAGWIGSMRGTARLVGDIVTPVVSDSEWEALSS